MSLLGRYGGMNRSRRVTAARSVGAWVRLMDVERTPEPSGADPLRAWVRDHRRAWSGWPDGWVPGDLAVDVALARRIDHRAGCPGQPSEDLLREIAAEPDLRDDARLTYSKARSALVSWLWGVHRAITAERSARGKAYVARVRAELGPWTPGADIESDVGVGE